MRVALLIDTLMQCDAIGNIFQIKLRAMQQAGMETRAFALSCEPDLRHLCTVGSLSSLGADPFLMSADVRVLEFGWCTPLTRLVTHAGASIRSAVYFHGVTPAEFAPAHLRSTARTTQKQLRSLRHADFVFCASHYSRQVLQSNGIESGRITVLPLPVDFQPVGFQPCTPVQRNAAPVNLLWVGRMVPSKGLHDLIEALRRIDGHTAAEWRLRIVTATGHRQAEYADQVQGAIDAAGLRSRITFTFDVIDPAAKAKLYADSDIVAIPSYHEGYCLPLLEALASSCAVVGYSSGATPESASGLARLVPRGDVAGLSEALRKALEACAGSSVVTDAHGLLPLGRFRELARARTAQLTPEIFSRQWIEALRDLGSRPRTVRQPMLRRLFGRAGI